MIPLMSVLVHAPEAIMDEAGQYPNAELYFGCLAYHGDPEFAREWWAGLPEDEQLGAMTRHIHRQLMNGKVLELTYGAAALEANGVDASL